MSAQFVEVREWDDRFAFRAEYTTATLRLVSTHDGDGNKGALAPRGVISGWSKRSRNRLTYRLGTLDIASQFDGVCEMITLTYPREYPTSGRTIKRHLAAWRKRMERRFGERSAVWKLEFQRRGAPHFHILYDRPLAEDDWRAFADEVRDMWFEVVGSGDDLHRRFGANVDRQWLAGSRYGAAAAAWYFSKRHEKHYQSIVPDEFQDVGRIWGVWRMSADVESEVISYDEFVAMRRMTAQLRGSRGRYSHSRVPGRLQGNWTLSQDGGGTFRRMLQCIRGEFDRPPPSRRLP